MVAVEVGTKENRKLALARGLPGTVNVNGASATVGDLKREIARQYPKARRSAHKNVFQDINRIITALC